MAGLFFVVVFVARFCSLFLETLLAGDVHRQRDCCSQ